MKAFIQNKVRKLIRSFLKKVITPIIQNRYQKYSESDHLVNFHGLSIKVNSGIFHPKFFLSTQVLVKYFQKNEVSNKVIVELGCGTGAFSCWAAKQGAQVIASDINPNAVENAKENAVLNKLKIESFESDLFENLHQYDFDYVVVNPPYYPNEPINAAEKAWFCGEEFEYFQRLFKQLSDSCKWKNAIMVLSEDCDIAMISKLANQNNLDFKKDWETITWLERNYIFLISKKTLN